MYFRKRKDILMAAISVIIPCYNASALLGRCLDSVLNQTFKDFEVICVNDGSTDDTLTLLKEYAARDSRVHIISQENAGVSVARNRGLAESNGDKISFVDADDCVHPQLLEVLNKFMEQEKSDLVSCRYVEFAEDVPSSALQFYDVNKLAFKTTEDSFDLMRRKEKQFQLGFRMWGRLYTRALAERHLCYPGLRYEDLLHCLCVSADSPRVTAVDVALYFYMIGNESFMRSAFSADKVTNYRTVIRLIDEYYKKAGRVSELKWIAKNIVPRLLKWQFVGVNSLNGLEKQKAFQAFRDELIELKELKLLLLCSGNFRRWNQFRRIIKGQPLDL